MSRLFEALQRAAAVDEVLESTPGRLESDPSSGIDAFVTEGRPATALRTAELRDFPSPRSVVRAVAAVSRTSETATAAEDAAAVSDPDFSVLRDADWHAAFNEYGRLAATLIDARRQRTLKSLIVTSAVAGEGKSLTAFHLALTFAESFRQSVLLIDADLRRPSLHDALQVKMSTGLADCVEMGRFVEGTPIRVSERLAFLPAGEHRSDPGGLLASSTLPTLVKAWSERFDWVVIDSPPAALTPDAGLLASSVDAVLLVIQAGKTPHQAVRQALSAIGPERVAGVVLNRITEETAQARYYRDGYGYSAEEPR